MEWHWLPCIMLSCTAHKRRKQHPNRKCSEASPKVPATSPAVARVLRQRACRCLPSLADLNCTVTSFPVTPFLLRRFSRTVPLESQSSNRNLTPSRSLLPHIGKACNYSRILHRGWYLSYPSCDCGLGLETRGEKVSTYIPIYPVVPCIKM